MAQQLRFALATRAHVDESAFPMAAHRQNVVFSGEDVDLADFDFVAGKLDGVLHHEQRIAIFLDLGTLVAVVRILDRQFVQVEFLLHRGEFAGPGIQERHPDEAIGTAYVVADFVGLDVGEFTAVLVCGAVDEH